MVGLGQAYEVVYGAICGRHPVLRPWHFQWLATKDLYRDLKRILPTLEGRIADVGCGDKPYDRWLNQSAVLEHTGIDVQPGAAVDVVVPREDVWPLPDEHFDVVICTQVLEHARNMAVVIKELHRILKPRGKLLVSLPFIYNAHGVPEDYTRLSVDGLKERFIDHFEVVELRMQGGIGSTLGLLTLNWIDCSLNLTQWSRLAKGVLLPVWIVISAATNMIGALLDKLDRTGSFYSNVLLLGIKR